jgi:hypothetical protein
MPHPNRAATEQLLSINQEQNRIQRELDRVQGSAPSLTEQRALKTIAYQYAPLFHDLQVSQPLAQPGEQPLAYLDPHDPVGACDVRAILERGL